jgi:hypothetical protein
MASVLGSGVANVAPWDLGEQKRTIQIAHFGRDPTLRKEFLTGRVFDSIADSPLIGIDSPGGRPHRTNAA